jgi:PhnB protein
MNMPVINSYLNFNGNTEEAFNFYKSVFGGDFPMVMRFNQVPPEHQASPAEANKIMHISLPIGKSSVLMGSDVPEAYGKAVTGTNVSLSISADTKEEADRLFKGLSAGGKTTMPMADTFWGSYFGMLTDKYDIQWMVSYDKARQ